MLTYAIIAFAAAAVGGLILANSVLRGVFAPWALSLLHAALGATGLFLVLVAVMQGAQNPALAALIILAVAALGGFFLASFHLRKQIPPKGIVIVHAVTAVTGFLLLAGSVFRLI
jgi:FtsH-binding integral membrane protein